MTSQSINYTLSIYDSIIPILIILLVPIIIIISINWIVEAYKELTNHTQNNLQVEGRQPSS